MIKKKDVQKNKTLTAPMAAQISQLSMKLNDFYFESAAIVAG